MKLTVNQLRRIIKEEVSTVLRRSRTSRRLREMQDEECQMEIPDVSMFADPEQFLATLNDVVAQLGLSSVEFGGANALDPGDGYSEEYDSIMVYGSRGDLTALAQELHRQADEDMGGAQSISSPDFVSLIEPVV